MNVFVDTSAFYAVLSDTDSNHDNAVSDWNRVMDDEAVRLCTSNYVVVETCALVRNRLGDDAMRSFLGGLLPLMMVIWVDQKAHAGRNRGNACVRKKWTKPGRLHVFCGDA